MKLKHSRSIYVNIIKASNSEHHIDLAYMYVECVNMTLLN